MKYKIFLELIMTYKKAEENITKWNNFGINLHKSEYPIAPYLYDLMITGFKTSYNKAGIDWISWFIFENEYGHKVWKNASSFRKNKDGTVTEIDNIDFGAKDKDGNPIAYSYESLWKLLEKDYRLD